MLTEVLPYNACKKAAGDSKHHAIGVDKKVMRLMRDRTEGNTIAMVWRQVQESHCGKYLCSTDLYITILSQVNKAGGIVCKYDLCLTAGELRNTEGTCLCVHVLHQVLSFQECLVIIFSHHCQGGSCQC